MRATLKAAVDWIAQNDEPDEQDVDVVSGTLTVALIADLFGQPADRVARRVVRRRQELE